jgi:hypothetical protein
MWMDLEITPEPSEAERAAIEAALAAEEAEESPSPWLQALLPQREEPPEA